MHIENTSDDPATYTDSGPGGPGQGCDEDNLRPKDKGVLKPIKKGDPPVEDTTISVGRRICFYTGDGAEYRVRSEPVWHPNAKIVLKPENQVEIQYPGGVSQQAAEAFARGLIRQYASHLMAIADQG